AETGPAISLTRAGERVLLDPEALDRLRAGQPLSAEDRGAIVRGVFRGRLIPHMTRLIVLVHVVVFVHGYLDARWIGAGKDFLSAPPVTAQVAKLLEDSGSLTARNLIDGQWWRLLTAGFVHVGFLYLLLNMVFLYLAGRY